MKNISFIILSILLATPAFASEISHSLPANYYIPQATPQSMYGLSGQQFVPQINITGSSSGIKIDSPYIDKSAIVKEDKPQSEPETTPIQQINPLEDQKLEPIYINK